MLSKGSQIREEIEGAAKDLMYGLVISIDPSIGSHSSMPGYAVYLGGKLNSSGIIEIDPDASIPERLCSLHAQWQKLVRSLDPDVLVYEKVPVSAHGGRSQVSHASLLYALGTILSVSGPSKYVGIMPVTWKKYVSPGYKKGDEQDAVEMGRICILLAKELQDENSFRKRKNK